VHNVDVDSHADPDEIRGALSRQAASPVRWTETVQWFAAHGVTQVVECGPGRVLSGLTRRIDDRLAAFALSDGAAIGDTRAALAA
jgi:[acyl-carrier-protein] S-malonyltransferase